MELASLQAGEPFTDRPRCVDPVIAAFLRAFNDRLDPRTRESLRPYAAAVVGTRGDHRVTRARRARCLRFASASRFPRLRVALLVGIVPAVRLTEGAAEWAAREAIIRGGEHGFALLDALLADGDVPSPRALVLEAAPLPLPVVGIA
ncbi:MAG: hypothetical protein QOE86_3563 [Solirubrobacteraceae bacterium]|jgi:hypothetical protein|nr:hypothetical protein [Solirubrobacteraceae bacterium]